MLPEHLASGGNFDETTEQFTARMRIIYGGVELSLRADRKRLEAEIVAMTEQRDAWKALAKAERCRAEAQRFGATCAREDAYDAVLVARDNLRALGVDPNA